MGTKQQQQSDGNLASTSSGSIPDTHAGTYYARALNQYKRPLGCGTGKTREEAVALARENAAHTLKTANANWKWRVVRIVVTTDK